MPRRNRGFNPRQPRDRRGRWTDGLTPEQVQAIKQQASRDSGSVRTANGGWDRRYARQVLLYQTIGVGVGAAVNVRLRGRNHNLAALGAVAGYGVAATRYQGRRRRELADAARAANQRNGKRVGTPRMSPGARRPVPATRRPGRAVS